MNTIMKLIMSVATVTTLSGCIGQSESSCPGIEKGVLCMGPRAIMEATNNHDDLKYLKKEGDVGKQDIADSQYPTTLTPPPGVQYPKKPVVNSGPKPLFSGTPQPIKPLTTASYVSQQHVPAGKGLYSEFDGKPVNPTLSAYQERQYQVQGTKQAVIAPEPLAVLRQGKVMRVLIAPYTDDNDALNLPGYVYVNVKPQTWVAGDSALKNPARIVPLEVQDRARDNMQQQQRSVKGVTAAGVTGSF